MKALPTSLKSWQEAQNEAYSIRKAVFIEEQGIPAAMEIDEFDPCAQHALIHIDEQCVATARLVVLPGGIGRIGRMAVLASYRKQGVGTQLINLLINAGKAQGLKSFELHAQLSAIPFYVQFGFISRGDVYDEAGIPHRDMILTI
ncbi:GNAT family N-acetyltransferase [Polynucleobacter brandtiae]|nr:GNAT family N-acetyltransferase [Polynucleobacter brandtiae]